METTSEQAPTGPPRSPRPLAWEPARVRCAEPDRARVLRRFALALAALPLALMFVAWFVQPPVAAPLIPAATHLETAAAWSRVGFVVAAACAIAAMRLARGVIREGGVALEARSLFIAARGSPQRRIPRRTIDLATVPRGGATVVVRLTNGRIYWLDLRDRRRAERLAEALRPPAGAE